MVKVIVQHEVKNFEEWKKVFDADKPNLKKEGVKLNGLYTSVNNKNEVTMIFKAPSPELFDKIMSDPVRQKEIEKGGVIGKLTVSILNKVLQQKNVAIIVAQPPIPRLQRGVNFLSFITTFKLNKRIF